MLVLCEAAGLKRRKSDFYNSVHSGERAVYFGEELKLFACEEWKEAGGDDIVGLVGRTGCKEKDMHLSLGDTFVAGRIGRVTHVHLGNGYMDIF